jgi:gamma-glutamyltranspeptidase/glutathione hydrolase
MLEFHSRRSPVLGTKGMVATSQPLAVAAGLQILSAGGNAADAAVATAAALNVTAPTSTGIGGDCFALYYDSQSRAVHALNGSGRAPQALTLDRLQREGFGEMLPPYHAYTVTVPGACAAWCDLVETLGRLDMDQVLAPAIRLADEGFPVAPLVAHAWSRGAEQQLSSAPNGIELTIDGRAPRAGEIFRNPGLARTLTVVAEGGKNAFYEGEIAEAIAQVVQDAGGCLDVEDLGRHTSTWETPISTVYKQLRIWECPPNGQGLAALLALNILEGFELAALPPLSAERLHLQIEALRLAFADAHRFVADPAFNPAPVEELLSPEYAAGRRSQIDPRHANPRQVHGRPLGSDTVYLSVVDGEGNACSFINSNYMGFGTGIVPSGWGFSLQNRGHNFTLVEGHPNAPAPGKRPYHTIIPALATHADDDALFASFGVMGGFMQPQGHVQVVLGMADDQEDPQTVLDRPRFCLVEGRPDGKVALEEGIPLSIMATLAHMGHDIVPVTGYERAIFGKGHIIMNDRGSGVRLGGSDPRGDGCAMTI